MTPQDIITRCRALLDDPDVPSDTKLLMWINDARKNIAREVDCIYDTYHMALEMNKYEYDLPSIMTTVNRVRVMDGDSINVLRDTSMQRMRDFNHSTKGLPDRYWLKMGMTGMNLVLHPTPSGDAPSVKSGYDIIDVLVPEMTSATAPSGEVIVGGGTLLAGEGFNIFDQNANTFATVDSDGAGGIGIFYDFGTPTTVDKFTITADPTIGVEAFIVESTNDLVNYNYIYQTAVEEWTTKETRTYNITPVTARYFGIVMLVRSQLPTIVRDTQGLYELQFYNTISQNYVSGDTVIPVSGTPSFPENGVIAYGSNKYSFYGLTTVPSGELIPQDGYTLDMAEGGIEYTTDVSIPHDSDLIFQNVEVTYTSTNPVELTLTDDLEHIFTQFPNVLTYYVCSQASLMDMDDVSSGISTKMQIFDGKYEIEKQKLINFASIPQDQYRTIRDYRLK